MRVKMKSLCSGMVCLLAGLLITNTAHALTLSGILGVGSSSSQNESTKEEGPFVQTFALEKLLSSRFALGVEHIRSLSSGLSTAIGFTGLLTRFYLNAAPVPLYKVEDLRTTDLSYRDYSLFLALGGGFAQSSSLPDPDGKSSNAAGLYLSPRVGVDYQLGRSLGVRAEFLLAMSLMGKGNLSTMSLGAGIYYFF